MPGTVPPTSPFRKLSSFSSTASRPALLMARELAGDDAIFLGGGADLIRQGLAAGVVELAISIALLIMEGGV
ncbi:hypothetical protein GCM10023350_52530 [Nocardioides endophyticus]|uniref:Bacterial bifunctional deaminase-reductase C-terminal domain-containing protein n=1 Tax=Nocardioides endophyticus TaxID=1353775 RepID=A0ABP8ZMG3_9ACTN